SRVQRAARGARGEPARRDRRVAAGRGQPLGVGALAAALDLGEREEQQRRAGEPEQQVALVALLAEQRRTRVAVLDRAAPAREEALALDDLGLVRAGRVAHRVRLVEWLRAERGPAAPG